MSDIAGVARRVDTSDLQSGNSELDKFQQKNNRAVGASHCYKNEPLNVLLYYQLNPASIEAGILTLWI
ncbi:hypothetical protein [Serratia fonticola]|uniref:hypothetical protein n=1 Tax=Serratia fonticola TaxID=47917 RepID=UPI0016462ED7|nr:hypothetical protein [Serratia fonticola]MBC3218813.1 hypothetical protein [Serratia fonticola]MDQ7207438.1 hypothetical protein [Serratia fonticola]HBE9077674.1 hypothetical protein [Serratia fonticola]HBE9088245.1 hypothetical protein [Serratia fonticola]HBE9150403.1 hypothetical protein [Serratia fonticola]